ncbi:MAG TPA: ABC transporter permease, partial [Gemmatimonadaceae bacterium]
ARTVVGVLPRSFDFPSPRIDIFYPAPVPVMPAQITARGLNVVGRLRKGVDPRAAEAELNALIPSLAARFPAITADMLQRSHAHISVQSLKAATAAPVRPQLTVLGVLVALVLLIATTNVGNLFLLRVERATAEVAIALSLGATRFSIAQRFIVEGIVLGIASTIVALPVAAVALSTKFGFTEREIPRLHEVSFGAMTAMIVFGGAATLGALIGATAFSRMGIDGQFDRLRAARSTPTAAWRRSQNALVAFQVAIALVLLVATALLGRSFWNLRNADIGFDPTNAMAFQVSLPWNGYTSYAAGAVFHAKLADRLAALPGVTSVAVALRLPLTGRGRSTLDLDLRGANDETRSSVKAVGNMVSADYFRVMKMRLSSGRGFRSGDLRGTPAVIVSERLAKSIFGTTDVVGQTVKELLAGRTPLSFTIIGVVGDVPFDRIEDGYAPTLYFPLQRDGDGVPADSVRVLARPMDVQYVIRGTQFPTASRIEQILKTLDRGIPPTDIRTLTSVVDDATARVRVTMLLIAVAGAAALWLGVIGVYSVVAYAADGRVREFGIRLALGAAPSRIGGIVLRDGLRVVAIGMVAGLIAAFGMTRFLRTLLYEVKPIGVPEFCGAAALLLLVTLLATLIPARRALRTDPSLVLRGE